MENEGVVRRTVLTGAAGLAGTGLAGAVGLAGTVALSGCQVYGGASGQPPAAQPGSEAGGSGGVVLAKAADIPVGGGKIFADKGVVVTQPTEGTLKAFSVTCTHQGCPVSEIAGGTINCTCHGSRFAIADGSVAKGPASRPLAAVRVTLTDGTIQLA